MSLTLDVSPEPGTSASVFPFLHGSGTCVLLVQYMPSYMAFTQSGKIGMMNEGTAKNISSLQVIIPLLLALWEIGK